MLDFTYILNYIKNIPDNTILIWLLIAGMLMMLNSHRVQRQYLKRIIGAVCESETGDRTLFIGNVDYSMSEKDLSNIFKEYGKIESVSIPVNRNTGRAKGYGFVTFESASDANKALSADGSEFKGRALQVNFAKGTK